MQEAERSLRRVTKSHMNNFNVNVIILKNSTNSRIKTNEEKVFFCNVNFEKITLHKNQTFFRLTCLKRLINIQAKKKLKIR